jgi:hypothetical protein
MTDQFPDATKMVVSPVAQAVLDAYKNAPDLMLDGDPDEVERRLGLAAALRAAASQFDRPKRSDAHTLWNEGFQYAQNVCRANLLNIADELESQ